MRIVVAGLGYVGLAQSVLLAQRHEVVALDVDGGRVALVNDRRSPIVDPDLEDYLATRQLDLTATTDPAAAYPGGTLGAINGVDYLVRVAAEMASIESRIAFVVVGEGAEQTKVEGLARNLGVLGVNLFLYPPVAKKEVPALFAAATVSTSLFIPLPEMEANSANKFFDSLAAGTPIAINYGGWQLDILNESGAGIGMDAHDYRRAAQQLADFIAYPPHLQAAAARARELAVTRFSRDILASELLQVLHRALAS